MKSPKITARGRYLLGGILMFLCLLSILYKMIGYTIIRDGARWRSIGDSLNRPIAADLYPLRGTIYAADHRPIALIAPSYQLFLDFKAEPLALLRRTDLKAPQDSVLIQKQKKLADSLSQELNLLADAIAASYAEQEVKYDKRAMRERWREGYRKQERGVPITRNTEFTYLQYQKLQQQPPFAPVNKRKSLIASILVTKERSRRINPFGSLGLRTIGSVYAEQENGYSKGKQGIELSYDSLLRGEIGKSLRIYAAKQRNTQVLQPAIDGASIYTTLDMNKQDQLERIMRRQLTHFSAKSGTAILMEVQTGKILAMTNLERLREGIYAETRNMAVTDMSEPGSTFKVASMLVALNDGVVRPSDTINVGNGIWHPIPNQKPVRDHNAHRGGYGKISVSQVIEYSSNVGTAKIIMDHYRNRQKEFVDKLRRLGFGDSLKLELIGTARAKIRKESDNPARWYKTTLPWMSFGYETQIPPIYTLAFFNAIANNGKFMRPYLVEEVVAPNGDILEHKAPSVMIDSIGTPRAIKDIQQMLRYVVERGTGKSVQSEIVAISGKSGTAQIARGGSYNGPDGKSHEVSFCGFFPSEAPRYTLMVVLREPSKEFSAGGGSMAGPVVRDLAEAIISMERPQSIDSLKPREDISSQPLIALGRKSALEGLSQQVLGKSPQGLNELPQEAMISLGKEFQAQPYPTYAKGVVPNVLGMSSTDAYYLLLRQGFIPKLAGYGSVTAQSIAAGTKGKQGATIILTLN